MLIRSQDKKNLININAAAQLYVDHKTVYVDFNNDLTEGYQELGDYSSEEDAIKVLDMIQETYTDVELAKQDYEKYNYVDDFTFEMPTEKEMQELS